LPAHTQTYRLQCDATVIDRDGKDELNERDQWLSAQREAFEAALTGAPLPVTLEILANAATAVIGSRATAAFQLRGLGADLTRRSDRLEGPLLAGGANFDHVADSLGCQGFWSFPVRSPKGIDLAAFAIFLPEPRDATESELRGVNIITQTAALVIGRNDEAQQRLKVEQSLLDTQRQLKTELEDSELLRQLGLELVDVEDESSLYRKLVSAAAKIMKSDVCTVQFYHPDRGPAGELQMLASVGLNEEGVKYWEWVRGDSGCTCGEVLRTGRRAIAEDVANCSFMAGTPDRDVLLSGGIKSGQSTPLKNREGRLVGMISTHWGHLHRPSDRELRMLDIIARPAADLIERKRAAETQRLLLNELNHRVKNTLAVVQAMAQRTLARTNDPKEFAKSFGGRVQSLARTHDLLSASQWQGADLHDLVRTQISGGSRDETRLIMEGPAVPLTPQMALHLALIFHELGTNATKYGALSVFTGQVRVGWKTVNNRLRIVWTECGGPTIVELSTRGFGTTLVTQSAKGQGGEAVMTMQPDGIEWEIDLPYVCGAKKTPQGAELAKERSASVIMKDAPDLGGRRILVVEDEPLIGLDMAAALEDVGAVVEGPVSTVEEACTVIDRSRFDAALVDANLRGRSVEEVAMALSMHGVPFAFATGYGREGLPEGFRDVPILGKPSDPEQVVETICRLLGVRCAQS